MQGTFTKTSIHLMLSGVISIAALIAGVSGNINPHIKVKTFDGFEIWRPSYVRMDPGDIKLEEKQGRGSLMLLALLIATGVSSYGAFLAIDASRQWDIEQDEAATNRDKARLVSEVQAEAEITAAKVLAEKQQEIRLLQQLQSLGVNLSQSLPQSEPVATHQQAIEVLPPVGQPPQLAAANTTTVADSPVAAQPADTQPKPIPSAPQYKLPDGAVLIEPGALNDNNRYPIVMVVAQQGSGKSVTMACIFEYLSGKKALATPKKQDHENPNLRGVYDIAFGYNAIFKTGRWIGHTDELIATEDRDLTWYLENQPSGENYINFAWATRQESLNRQQHGMKADTPYWRVFADEWSQTYLGGFKNPAKTPQDEKKAKGYLEAAIADAFMNFRGQRVQFFVGSQTESVETVGLQNLSSIRDESWHLYPGLGAIAAAKKLGKDSLAMWLQQRVSSGHGIALLERQGVFLEVINLPPLEYLKKFDPPAL